MAETPAPQCPSCGSSSVAPISLSMIAARYYECRACKVMFRRTHPGQDIPDIDRFNDGWSTPPEKPKK